MIPQFPTDDYFQHAVLGEPELWWWNLELYNQGLREAGLPPIRRDEVEAEISRRWNVIPAPGTDE